MSTELLHRARKIVADKRWALWHEDFGLLQELDSQFDEVWSRLTREEQDELEGEV